MGYRKFVDRDGHSWEVRPRTRADWNLEPVAGNPGPARSAPAPGYEADPFELSTEELQRLLDRAPPPSTHSRPSPFKD